mgnify:CR=1 FL=1|jgi:hypothetical protein
MLRITFEIPVRISEGFERSEKIENDKLYIDYSAPFLLHERYEPKL